MEQWSETGFTLDSESIRDIEFRLRDYLRESGNLCCLTGGHEPPSKTLVDCPNPTVFHISNPHGQLIAELVLSPQKKHRLFVELRTDPKLDDETRAQLIACIDPAMWYSPALKSLTTENFLSRSTIIDNIGSTLNYFVRWLALRSRSAYSTIPGYDADMEITELTGHESGITNPIKVHQQIVLRSRKQDLPEWRGTAIHYTLEEIAPGRIRLESFCLETELTAVLFDLKIKRILDTWPEARRRTEVEKPENSSAAPAKTILFIASDPSDLSRLRLDDEIREISEKLQLAKRRDMFKFEPRHATRVTDLTQALLDIHPNIVHFSGHGTSEGSLCLQDSSGLAHSVPPDALGALFGQFAGNVDCVILNVCHSLAQAAIIAKHIPYVIGMNEDIPDQAAVAFSVGFYQALGAGRSIEEAYQLGRIQIALQGIPEDLIPVLILKGT